MKHTLELNITKGIAKEVLQGFVDALPPEAKIETDAYHQEGDRPWESASTTVTLRAEW